MLARHVEGASHMAEGYTRTRAGNIGVCVGTSGPAGTDMITGLYSASADSIPILCITGQAPVARLHKEDFQAVDIASIAAPLTKMAVTVLEAAQVPGVFAKAFHLMRSGRPGPVLIDLPFDVQMTEIEFDPDTYTPLPAYKPAASRAQVEKALDMLQESTAPVIVAGGGIINADASELLVELAEILDVPVIPTLMGWGAIPDDHRLMAGMAGLQTAHQYGNATMLASDFVLGIGNRWANRHTGGLDTYRRGRTFVHVDIEPTQIGRVFAPDYGIVSDARAALALFVEVAKERREQLRDRRAWVDECVKRKQTMLRRTHFDDVPVKPQRVYEEMNRAFGRDTRYVSTIGLSQIAGGQFLHVYQPRHWINAGQAGPLGWTLPAALGVCVADPDATVVALSGDYDFQFMLEELAVGAQFHLPYVHVVVNNSYLGLIRQSQRGFEMDYCVQLSFENVNTPELGAYGVDHVKVAEGLGCKAIRVDRPDDLASAFEQARKLMAEFRVPVVVEVLLERVTNISMGTELDNVVEFEELADAGRARPDRHRAARLKNRISEPQWLRDAEWDANGGSTVHVVVAPDKFKGSLTAREVADRVAAGITAVHPEVEVVRVPVADGGDGTVDAAIAAGYERIPLRATGPTGEPVDTAYAMRDGVAVVEMADVSGLRLLPPDRLAPLTATSYGTGEVVRAALDRGCSSVVLGIGGSASTDGGAGMLEALGVRLLDAAGNPLPRGGGALADLDRVDLSGLHPAVAGARIVVACDVDNPLLGRHGAAAVYGPQKGATPDDVTTLDAALAHWADVVDAATGRPDVRNRAGAGAAGGVGYAAMAVLGAELEPGIGLVLDLVRFADHLPGASLVITGEGSLDEQTLHGKAPAGVAAAAAKAGIPVVTVSGRLALDGAQLQTAGIAAAYALTDIEPDVQRCLADAGPLLERLATNLARERIGGTTP